jgi:hypothetical protein
MQQLLQLRFISRALTDLGLFSPDEGLPLTEVMQMKAQLTVQPWTPLVDLFCMFRLGWLSTNSRLNVLVAIVKAASEKGELVNPLILTSWQSIQLRAILLNTYGILHDRLHWKARDIRILIPDILRIVGKWMVMVVLGIFIVPFSNPYIKCVDPPAYFKCCPYILHYLTFSAGAHCTGS